MYFFIYRSDLHEAGKHPIDFIGWYSQDFESVAYFAQRHPDYIYFAAALTVETDVDIAFNGEVLDIDMNEVAVLVDPERPTPPKDVHVFGPGEVTSAHPELSEWNLEPFFIIGQMPGTLNQSIINVWRWFEGYPHPTQPFFTEEELQVLCIEWPEQIFFIGGTVHPEGN